MTFNKSNQTIIIFTTTTTTTSMMRTMTTGIERHVDIKSVRFFSYGFKSSVSDKNVTHDYSSWKLYIWKNFLKISIEFLYLSSSISLYIYIYI